MQINEQMARSRAKKAPDSQSIFSIRLGGGIRLFEFEMQAIASWPKPHLSDRNYIYRRRPA